MNYSLYRFIQHFLLITQIKDKVNEYRKVNDIQQTGSVFPGYSVICSGLYNWGRDYHYHRELYINCSLQNRKALLIYVAILLKCQFKLLKTLRSIFVWWDIKAKLGTWCYMATSKGSFSFALQKNSFWEQNSNLRGITEFQRENSSDSFKNSLPIINNELQLNNNRCSKIPNRNRWKQEYLINTRYILGNKLGRNHFILWLKPRISIISLAFSQIHLTS